MVSEEKKKRKRLLLVNENAIDRELPKSLTQIKARLISFFRMHVGKENAANPYDIFYSVLQIEPFSVDVFKRNYMWSVLRRILAQMRTSNELFVVHRGTTQYFVLKSAEELMQFNHTTDRYIKTLKQQKHNAKVWVRQRKFLDF